MKTEAEITDQLAKIKEAMLDLSGAELVAAQGFARALRWTLDDTEEETKDESDEQGN